MKFDAHKNFAYSTVLTAPSPAASGTSLVVQSGDGAKFPAVPFNASIWPVSTQPTITNAEIVRVTAISTDTFTITRTQESTSARTVVVGDQIAAVISAKTITDIENVASVPPTDLKLSTASKGGVFNGNFEAGTPDSARTTAGWISNQRDGWYLAVTATAVSAEFDTSAVFKGKQSLLIETTDATGRAVVYNTQGVTLTNLSGEGIPLKASTAYILHGYIKPLGVPTDGAYFDIAQYDSAAVVGTTNTSAKVTGTGGWQQKWQHVKLAFTTDADAVWGRIGLHNDVAGSVTKCWFDNFKLEEVVTDTTFTGKITERIRPIFQAISSYGIDQSLDTGGAYANTYALTAAVNEGATHRQTFTPTKKYIGRISVWVVAKGTGNWNIVLHDASNNLLGAGNIANASLTNGQMNIFDVPYIWSSGACHFHVISTVADGTLKSNTTDDLEDGSFIQEYSKKCQAMEIICNGVATRLEADVDGILSNSIWDIDNAKYLYAYDNVSTATRKGKDIIRDLYSYSAGGFGFSAGDFNSNGWNLMQGNDAGLTGASDNTQRDLIYKVNTILPIRHVRGIVNLYLNTAGNTAFEVGVSVDNQNYSTVLFTGAIEAQGTNKYIFETDLVNGASYFFLRIRKTSSVTNYGIMGLEDLNIDVDTLKLPQALFYPLALNQFTETIKLPVNATRVYFNLPNSWTVNNVGNWPLSNKDNALIPSLIFTTVNGTYIGHLFLPIDNSQETNPCIGIIASETTNGQASGTGSNDTTNGVYILNDGEYMTLSTAVSEIKIVYRIGTGTTTFANITKNTHYLISGGSDDDLTQDPSHQFNAIVGVRQQGLLQRILDIGDEIASIKKNPILQKNEIVAVGTGYTLTTSLAVINFATSGNLELYAGEPGIYEVTLDALDDLSGVTASAAANYSLYQLYLDGVALAATERLGTGISITTGATVGFSKRTVHLNWFIQVLRPGQLISVYAKQNSATTGNWVIQTGTTGQTRLAWKKII